MSCAIKVFEERRLIRKFSPIFACGITKMLEKRENFHYNNKRNKSVTVREEAILL